MNTWLRRSLEFLSLRHTMNPLLTVKMRAQQHLLKGPKEKDSLDQSCSEQEQMEERPGADLKIDGLHHSLDRLRQFVGGLTEDEVTSVPSCVEEYCDNMAGYRIRSKDEVVLIGQRRLNKMLRNRKIKKNWNGEDIILLVWLVCKRIQKRSLVDFSQFSKQDWKFISQLISGSDWQNCKFKWLSLKKVKLMANKWSKFQSKLLSELVAAISELSKIDWKLISQMLYEKNPNKNKVFRTPKQCRQHWNCFLNPNIQKGPWSSYEDRKLLEYVMELEGERKWSQIAKFMDGRTQNALKNRYNFLIKRQKQLSGRLAEKKLMRTCLSRLILEEGRQEKIQLPSPLAIEPGLHCAQVAASQNQQPERRPIIPTVVSPTFPSHITYHNGLNNPLSYMSNILGQQTPYYISFLFPNQFS